jgi:hypothetical protein
LNSLKLFFIIADKIINNGKLVSHMDNYLF